MATISDVTTWVQDVTSSSVMIGIDPHGYTGSKYLRIILRTGRLNGSGSIIHDTEGDPNTGEGRVPFPTSITYFDFGSLSPQKWYTYRIMGYDGPWGEGEKTGMAVEFQTPEEEEPGQAYIYQNGWKKATPYIYLNNTQGWVKAKSIIY